MAVVCPTPNNSQWGFRRTTGTAQVAIHTSLTSCDEISMENWADAAILVPAGVTSLTFYGCATKGGTYKAIYGNDVLAAALMVTADNFYTFPTACFAHSFIRIVSAGSTGTATCVFKS